MPEEKIIQNKDGDDSAKALLVTPGQTLVPIPQISPVSPATEPQPGQPQKENEKLGESQAMVDLNPPDNNPTTANKRPSDPPSEFTSPKSKPMEIDDLKTKSTSAPVPPPPIPLVLHQHEHYKEHTPDHNVHTVELPAVIVPSHNYIGKTHGASAAPNFPKPKVSKMYTLFTGEDGRSSGCCGKRSKEKDHNNMYRLQSISLPYWIKILAKFSYLWEFILYMLTLSSFSIVTYSAFFAFYEERLWDLNYLTDFLFNLDVVVRLLVEIWRFRNQINVVVFTVPYSLFQFLLDLFAITPFHQVFIWVIGTNNIKYINYIDYFRFNRFFRLYRSYKFSLSLENERRVNEKLMFFIRFTNYYLICILALACLLMFFTPMTPLDFLLTRGRGGKSLLSKSWMKVVEDPLGKYFYPLEEPIQIFALAFSLATATTTTVGYGDLYATNETEMVICIIFMLIGAIFLNGYFTSQLTTFELELDGARFDLFFRLNEIKKYLKTVGTLPIFNAKVEEYYKYLWSYREGVYEVQFIKSLPLSFHEDILFDICQEMFEKSFLFNGSEEALLRAVSKIVQVALYNPQMILCRKGGYANKLFYILQGECRVMSKYMSGKPAAILRAGSIIGEANLFFSFPYTATIETQTCCQFLTLEKEEFIKILTDFREQLLLLRTKSQEKVIKLYEMHNIYGVEPICWVAAKTDLKNPSEPKASTIRRTMRWGHGLNKEVIEDVIDDTKHCVIFDTPCLNKKFEKNHLTPYITCTVPEILDTEMDWVKTWNNAMMINALFFALMGPYCVSFGENSEFQKQICELLRWVNYVMAFVYAFDVFVEIIAAAPVFGLYYKFWDGLKVKKHSPLFYLDLLAAIPFCFYSTRQQDYANVFDTIFKSLKLMKIIRYLHFLDNRYPLQLFWFRLCQTILVLMYGIHFISCISFYLACFEDPLLNHELVCHSLSWMKSYELKFETTIVTPKVTLWRRLDTLRDSYPYMYSFFYSSATLTSAGFGDFNPQRFQEMAWAVLFQLVGFFLIGYYTSVLTSALSCVVRPKLTFQQKLISIKQFMAENHMKENLSDRIVEYFHLQNQLRGGVPFSKGIFHMMYDTPEYLRDDVLYLEIADLIEGIPIFSKVDSEVIIKMSSLMKRFVIPPGTTFLHKGEIRRVMYLIKHGSVGIFSDYSDEPLNILEASSHFGVRDLLFGEPCHFTVKSLSYVFLYSIKYNQVQEALWEESEFWALIDQEKERLQPSIDEMIIIYSQYSKTLKKQDEDIVKTIPSWIKIPKKIQSGPVESNDPDYWDKKHAFLVNSEYDSLFKLVRFGWLWKLFLMKRTIHPVGTFAHVWSCLLSITSFVTVIFMCIETFQSFRRPLFRMCQWFLDLLAITGIYINMHWGYYNTKQKGNSMLITHPLKTAVNYILNGTFILDVLGASPIELILPIIGWTDIFGYGEAAVWYTKLRWTRILQLKRMATVFEIAHTIFKRRVVVLLSLYIIMSLFLCTLLASISLYTSCPWGAQFWKQGDENRMPVCQSTADTDDELDIWATKNIEPDTLANPLNRWILGVYYVSQTLLVIGFGDLITLRTADLLILIFMSVFGFIFMRCVIADITAAEVDNDDIRSNYLERIKTINLVMQREQVPKRLVNTVMEHMNYTWKRSKGLQPRDIFADLHLSLESDLFKELVGKELAKVSLFRGIPANILKTISGFLKKIYFLRGERIMRCGNLENEMNIILHGKVYIADSHFNYMCTLTIGDCFGESGMIKGKRRCYNAIAITNVELYYLTESNFNRILERYPTIKSEFQKKLGGGERDYFEQGLDTKIKKMQEMSSEQQKVLINAFNIRSKIIRSCLSAKEDLEGIIHTQNNNWLSLDYWFGYGSRDEDLPVVYFAKGRYRKIGNTFSILIHPKCSFIGFFSVMICNLCLVTSVLATYETCFIGGVRTPKEKDGITILVRQVSFVIEITFLIYLFLKFITPFEASEGIYCKTYRGIFLRYVSSPLRFWVDLIGCLPFIVDLATGQDLQDSNSKFVFFLKLVRLYRYFQYHSTKKNNLSVTTFRYKLTASIIWFCLMAHFLACLFYLISPCQTDHDPKIADNCKTETGGDTWTDSFATANDLEGNKDFIQWKWWIRSLYWVVTTVSTTGFGDIVAVNVEEMSLAIFSIFCGAFILSVILSSFTVGLASATKPFREYMYQVQLLVKHFRNIGLSPTRQNQVLMHFLMMWDRCRGTSYNTATSILPICMQIEVCRALFGDCLSTIPYFKGHDQESFIRQISNRVNHSIFIPGLCIVKEGDYGSSLFIVFKGLVAATRIQETKVTLESSNESKQSKKQVEDVLLCVYNVGDVFGRFPALFHDECYKKSYRAETRVEVLELKQKEILYLCEHFPYFKRNMVHLINSRYSKDGSSINIFSEIKQKRDLFNLDEEIRDAQAEVAQVQPIKEKKKVVRKSQTIVPPNLTGESTQRRLNDKPNKISVGNLDANTMKNALANRANQDKNTPQTSTGYLKKSFKEIKDPNVETQKRKTTEQKN